MMYEATVDVVSGDVLDVQRGTLTAAVCARYPEKAYAPGMRLNECGNIDRARAGLPPEWVSYTSDAHMAAARAAAAADQEAIVRGWRAGTRRNAKPRSEAPLNLTPRVIPTTVHVPVGHPSAAAATAMAAALAPDAGRRDDSACAALEVADAPLSCAALLALRAASRARTGHTTPPPALGDEYPFLAQQRRPGTPPREAIGEALVAASPCHDAARRHDALVDNIAALATGLAVEADAALHATVRAGGRGAASGCSGKLGFDFVFASSRAATSRAPTALGGSGTTVIVPIAEPPGAAGKSAPRTALSACGAAARATSTLRCAAARTFQPAIVDPAGKSTAPPAGIATTLRSYCDNSVELSAMRLDMGALRTDTTYCTTVMLHNASPFKRCVRVDRVGM